LTAEDYSFIMKKIILRKRGDFMARYISILPMNRDPEISFSAIHQHLSLEGYKYKSYHGEDVFQKGNGIVMAPTFIKVTYLEYAVRLEAWMKYAIVPGVYMSEIGLNSVVGTAVKGSMRKNIGWIEQYLGGNPCMPGGFCGCDSDQMPAYGVVPAGNPVPMSVEPPAMPPAFCVRRGSQLNPGDQFCANCGNPIR
jgi:hypothetical protein